MNPRRPMRCCRVVAVVLAAVVLLALPATAAAQEQPKRGGTLVLGMHSDAPHINSGFGNDQTTVAISGQIHNTLIRQDPNFGIQPELAERWEISQDKLTYTFHLRKNVKWHDGKPFTSADVKFSLLEVNRKFNGQASTGLAAVESIETPDPYTAVFKLKYAFPEFFPWSLATPAMAQITSPRHLYEGTDMANSQYNFKPVGTGPFVFKEWVKGSHVTLERNPDYFKPGLPYLDRLIFKIIPDDAARIIALEKGEVDHLLFQSLPATAVGDLSKKQDVEVVDALRPQLGQIIAFFNLRHPQLKIKEVRHAIAYAVDRKTIVDRALDGRGIPSTSPIPSGMKVFYNPGVRKFELDPARANQLLDQAGLPRKADGTRLSLRISFTRAGEGGALRSAAEMMREQLRPVGIDLQLQPMDPAAWIDSSQVKWDFDVTMGSFASGPDPATGVGRLYITSNIKPLASHNLMGYSNPRVDELFDLSQREMDEAKRVVALKEAQLLMVEDLPALWLWEKSYPFAQKKTVKGLPSGLHHFEPFDGAWLTTAEGGGPATPVAAIVVGLVVVALAGGAALAIRRFRAA